MESLWSFNTHKLLTLLDSCPCSCHLTVEFPFQYLFLGLLVEILLLAIPAVLLELSETRSLTLINLLNFFPSVANLAKPGTFAGNDAIVAFARNNQMNVVIHQLNAPLWQVRKKACTLAWLLIDGYKLLKLSDPLKENRNTAQQPCLAWHGGELSLLFQP